jgi:hypothetical protein
MITHFIVTVAVLTMGVYSMANDLVYGQELKTLDVVVNLNNVKDNIGTYDVVVTTYGDAILSKSRTIDTSSQTCPDDIESLCYSKAGTFSFPSESAPIDTKIQACVKEPTSGMEACVDGINSSKNSPETIWVNVPVKK